MPVTTPVVSPSPGASDIPLPGHIHHLADLARDNRLDRFFATTDPVDSNAEEPVNVFMGMSAIPGTWAEDMR